ncbi:MAG: serine protease [Bacteroidetes bacterium]|nr:serine protease [Bacteroidota bacterium]
MKNLRCVFLILILAFIITNTSKAQDSSASDPTITLKLRKATYSPNEYTTLYYKSRSNYDRGIYEEDYKIEKHSLDPATDYIGELEKHTTKFLTEKGIIVLDTLNPLYNEKQVYYIMEPIIVEKTNVDIGSDSKFERKIMVSVKYVIYNHFDEVVYEYVRVAQTDFIKVTSPADFEKLVKRDDMYTTMLNNLYENDEINKILDRLKAKEKAKIEFAEWPVLDLKTSKATDSIAATDYANSSVIIDHPDFKGSGSLISDDGYIVTTVTNLDEKEEVDILYDDKKYTAKVIRQDKETNLCLLKSDIAGIGVIKIFNGKSVPSYSTIFIVATLNNELGNSISKGIVTGKRKFYNIDYIQTDARINKGNSGGAMITDNGQLIGVVVGKMTGKNVEGLGFAVSSKYIAERLKINFSR